MLPPNLQGLNSLFSPSPPADSALSDADLANTLALWTNIDFSYDDGGIGLNSGLKLLEEDRAREAAAAAHAGNFLHDQPYNRALPKDKAFYPPPQPENSPAPTDDFNFNPPHRPSLDGPVNPLDPFGFNSTLFALSHSNQADLQMRFPQELPPTFHAPSSTPSAHVGLPSPNSTPAASTPAAQSLKRDAAQAELGAAPRTSSSSAGAAKPSPPEQDEEISHEDDKRRRNTAASARFRAKKKEREQALEKSSKELQNRCALLEKEVESLRRENVWLKGLVVGGGNGGLPIMGGAFSFENGKEGE